MEDQHKWIIHSPEETTTLAVPKGFSRELRDEYKGANDMARLVNWGKKEFGYKDSITNEDIVAKIQELNEKLNDSERKNKTDYKDSITEDDIDDIVRQAVRDIMEEVMRQH